MSLQGFNRLATAAALVFTAVFVLACTAAEPDRSTSSPQLGDWNAESSLAIPSLADDAPCAGQGVEALSAVTGRCQHRTCFYTPKPASGVCPVVTGTAGCGAPAGYCVAGTERLACAGPPTQSGDLTSACWSFRSSKCGFTDPDDPDPDPCAEVVPFHCESDL